jgi:hypothetical protein
MAIWKETLAERIVAQDWGRFKVVLVEKLAVSNKTSDGFDTWLLTIFTKFHEGLVF